MSRTIENKVKDLSPTISETYGDWIMLIVKTPRVVNGQAQPINYDDLKKIKRVDDVVTGDKLKQKFIFEDSDYDFIKERLTASTFGWPYYHKFFLEFTEYLIDVPMDKEEKKKGK